MKTTSQQPENELAPDIKTLGQQPDEPEALLFLMDQVEKPAGETA